MIFLLLLAGIGLSHILVDGSIFNSIRDWFGKNSSYKLINFIKNKIFAILTCYQCSGFWSGIFISLLAIQNSFLIGYQDWYQVLSFSFIFGCAVSYLSPKAAVIIMYLQESNSKSNETNQQN